jgi:hypothetical protein
VEIKEFISQSRKLSEILDVTTRTRGGYPFTFKQVEI